MHLIVKRLDSSFVTFSHLYENWLFLNETSSKQAALKCISEINMLGHQQINLK